MSRTRRSLTIVAIACLAGLAPATAEEEARAIVEKAFAAARQNDARTREYVYHERVEQRRFNRRGEETSRRAETWDVTLFEGSDYRRLIAVDDRPLDPRAEAREQRRLDKHLRQLASETPRQRQKRLAAVEREHREGEAFLEHITRAFDFRLLGEEEVGGLATWVIAAEPKPGYRPVDRMTRVLPKVRAKLWVAQDDHGWVRAEIETLGDVTWGVVYRLRQGARISFEQRRLDDGVWVTERWNVRLRANIALVYRLRAELIGSYDNFRRFSTETTTSWTPADDPG